MYTKWNLIILLAKFSAKVLLIIFKDLIMRKISFKQNEFSAYFLPQHLSMLGRSLHKFMDTDKSKGTLLGSL